MFRLSHHLFTLFPVLGRHRLRQVARWVEQASMKCNRSVCSLFPVLLLLAPGDARNNQVRLQQVAGPSRIPEWATDEVSRVATIRQPPRAPDGPNKQ